MRLIMCGGITLLPHTPSCQGYLRNVCRFLSYVNFVFVLYTKRNVQLQTAGRLLWVCQMWDALVYSVCGGGGGGLQSRATLSPFPFFSCNE